MLEDVQFLAKWRHLWQWPSERYTLVGAPISSESSYACSVGDWTPGTSIINAIFAGERWARRRLISWIAERENLTGVKGHGMLVRRPVRPVEWDDRVSVCKNIPRAVHPTDKYVKCRYVHYLRFLETACGALLYAESLMVLLFPAEESTPHTAEVQLEELARAGRRAGAEPGPQVQGLEGDQGQGCPPPAATAVQGRPGTAQQRGTQRCEFHVYVSLWVMSYEFMVMKYELMRM